MHPTPRTRPDFMCEVCQVGRLAASIRSGCRTRQQRGGMHIELKARVARTAIETIQPLESPLGARDDVTRVCKQVGG